MNGIEFNTKEAHNRPENQSEIVEKDLRAALFARAFVMPRDKFEHVVILCSKNGKCDINEVANVFNVDYFSVLTRGEELNIW